jgi:hypothetical protein
MTSQIIDMLTFDSKAYVSGSVIDACNLHSLSGRFFILADCCDRIERCDVVCCARATERLELHCIVVILNRAIQKCRFLWIESGEIDEF